MDGEKTGMIVGGLMLAGLAAYAFCGGKDSGGYLEAWKKDQESGSDAEESEPASNKVPSGDHPSPGDEPPLMEGEPE